GGSFGGHAWVEVYAGQWIEMDPTWGTNFVDATHLRQETEDLTTYAALNLASVEVLEAPRLVPDFQRDPALLVEKICEQLSEGVGSALRFAVDIRPLTDQVMGAGTWASLNDREREQLSAAYNRLISTLSKSYSSEGGAAGMRVLNVKPAGDRAEALVMAPTSLEGTPLRLKLERAVGAWTVTDILDIDSDFHILAENVRPAVERILAHRNGGHAEMNVLSTRGRIAALLTDDDPKAALELVERELEKDPRSQSLRHLKAVCLESL